MTSFIVTAFLIVHQLSFSATEPCTMAPLGCPYFNPIMKCAEHLPACNETTRCPKCQICCRINCIGYQCVSPVKQGSCPPNNKMCVQSPPGQAYANSCKDDMDCPCQQRCCASCPGPQCIQPLGVCPPNPGRLGYCTPNCASNADCTGGRVCCKDDCGGTFCA